MSTSSSAERITTPDPATVVLTLSPSPEAQAIVQAVQQSYAACRTGKVTSQTEYELAAAEVIANNAAVKRLTDMRMEITRPMDEAKKRAMALFAPPIEAAEKVVGFWKRGMAAFEDEQRRVREAAERAAREEREAAERAARAEAERIRRESEARERAEREAAEEQRKAAAEAERKAQAEGDAEAAAQAQRDREAADQRDRDAQAAAEAARLEANAQEDVAELVAGTAIAVTAAPAPTAAGIQTRKLWKAEVTDVNALITAAAAGIANGDMTLASLLEPNTSAIGKMAKALMQNARIPGVRVFAETNIAASRK